jgi:molecular chaperone GrpE
MIADAWRVPPGRNPMTEPSPTTTRDSAEAPPQPAPPADETAALRARAEKAEQERDQYLNLAKQTRADFENYQKRQQRDLAEERRYAQRPLALDLLTALDNLERATEAGRKAGETGPLIQGVAMVQSQLLDALRRHGVTPIEALGQPFDPHLHQAVAQQPSADQPPMTVVKVLQQGFTLHDRVLRPASVIVSAPPDKPE